MIKELLRPDMQIFMKRYGESPYLLQRKAYMFFFFIIINFMLILFLSIHTIIFMKNTSLEFVIIFGLLLMSFLMSAHLLRSGYYNGSVNLMIFSMLIALLAGDSIAVYRVFQTGDRVHVLWIRFLRHMYPAIIVIAMLFCRRIYIWISSAILIVSGLTVYAVIRYVLHISSDEFVTSTFFNTTSFLMIVMVSIISRRITDDVQEKLESYAGNLENLVEERTDKLKAVLEERERMNASLVKKTEEMLVLKEEAERMARTDALTGLNNRLAFMEYSAHEISRSVRYGHSLSLLMVDIDHFKFINDSYGHAAGDMVLKDIADVIRNGVRENDYPSRIGGEEFTVVLPETGLESALHVAKRLRFMIEATVSTNGRAVTCSIGMASLKPNEKTVDNMLFRADKALYLAKNNGRNRVEVIE